MFAEARTVPALLCCGKHILFKHPSFTACAARNTFFCNGLLCTDAILSSISEEKAVVTSLTPCCCTACVAICSAVACCALMPS
jgi:hypothetical protein